MKDEAEHLRAGESFSKKSIQLGIFYYLLTAVPVVLGILFSHAFLRQEDYRDLISFFCSWDGQGYKLILEQGYSYNPELVSTVTFFPAYPLAGRFLAGSFGLRSEVALLIVSHLSLVGAFVVLACYVRQRFQKSELAHYVLLAFGLFQFLFIFAWLIRNPFFFSWRSSFFTAWNESGLWSLSPSYVGWPAPSARWESC